MELHHNFSFNPNISLFESVIRIILGFVLIGYLLITPANMVSGWQLLLPLLGAYFVNSAIVRWDPLYELALKVISLLSMVHLIKRIKLTFHSKHIDTHTARTIG